MGNPDTNIFARQMFQEAIELDPDYAEAYSMLAHTYLSDVRDGRSESPQKSIEQAFNMAQKALEIDESNCTGLSTISVVYMFQSKFEEAVATAKQALALAPNDYYTLCRVGLNLMKLGVPEKAIPYFNKATRINPLSPFFALALTGSAYRDMGKYEKAITFYEKVLSKNPDDLRLNLFMIICYTALGREEEARPYVEKALKIDPEITYSKHLAYDPRKDKALKKHYIELLRKAGLPD